jgi:methylmalonyl-CoA mutase, N-terminal domain
MVSAYDEAYSIPSTRAQRIALRTQQIVALETGACRTGDPLAGSYLVESLTDELERRAVHWMQEVDRRGGMLAAVESGWVESLLAEQAYRIQRGIETGTIPLVGVNMFTEGTESEEPADVFRVDSGVEHEQIARLQAVKARRDAGQVKDALARVVAAADGTDNLMYPILEAVRADASEGEIIGALRAVWGDYRPAALY